MTATNRCWTRLHSSTVAPSVRRRRWRLPSLPLRSGSRQTSRVGSIAPLHLAWHSNWTSAHSGCARASCILIVSWALMSAIHLGIRAVHGALSVAPSESHVAPPFG